MLAVLAIAGVLSIIALVGFTYAMNKHKANETVMDVMLRGTNVPMIDENYALKDPGHEFRFPGMPSSGKKGTYYEMVTLKSRDSAYFVEATDVSEAVCKMILKMNPTDIDQIIVDGTVYLGDESICDDGAAMQFCFGDDLCEDVDCGANGEFIGGKCECVNDYSGLYCETAPDCQTTEDCEGVRVCSDDKKCVCPEELNELTECREEVTENGCPYVKDKENGTQCADGVCYKGECGCLTMEEIACEGWEENLSVPVLSAEGCAYGCASPDACPENTQFSFSGDGENEHLGKTETDDVEDDGYAEVGACVSTFPPADGSGGGGGGGGAGGCSVWSCCVIDGNQYYPRPPSKGGGICCDGPGETAECCTASSIFREVTDDGKQCCFGSRCAYTMTQNPVGPEVLGCRVDDFENPIGGGVVSDCEVTGYVSPVARVEANCFVSGYNTGISSGNLGLLNPSGCDDGYYCDVSYTDQGCDSDKTLDDAGASTMYGVCTRWADSGWYCPQKTELGKLNTTGCGDGEYCEVKYSKELGYACIGDLDDSGDETMYGVCTKWATSGKSCRQWEHLPLLNPTECPQGQYCEVRYADEDYGQSLTDAGAPKMYGVCTNWNTSGVTYKQPVHLSYSYLNQSGMPDDYKCPRGMYCQLLYTTDSYTTELPNLGSDPMYGYCLPYKDSTRECVPIQRKNDF